MKCHSYLCALSEFNLNAIMQFDYLSTWQATEMQTNSDYTLPRSIGNNCCIPILFAKSTIY
ncbi:hypothetical protein BpHYR1_028104, partial [Brachionus plicatilis]